MSKAMLIIDMPDNCYQCSCLQAEISYGTIRKHICGADYHKITELYKRNNCPLKPMPSREDIHEEIYQAYGLGKEEPYERMRDAVDKVLDEILGEEYE